MPLFTIRSFLRTVLLFYMVPVVSDTVKDLKTSTLQKTPSNSAQLSRLLCAACSELLKMSLCLRTVTAKVAITVTGKTEKRWANKELALFRIRQRAILSLAKRLPNNRFLVMREVPDHFSFATIASSIGCIDLSIVIVPVNRTSIGVAKWSGLLSRCDPLFLFYISSTPCLLWHSDKLAAMLHQCNDVSRANDESLYPGLGIRRMRCLCAEHGSRSSLHNYYMLLFGLGWMQETLGVVVSYLYSDASFVQRWSMIGVTMFKNGVNANRLWKI